MFVFELLNKRSFFICLEENLVFVQMKIHQGLYTLQNKLFVQSEQVRKIYVCEMSNIRLFRKTTTKKIHSLEMIFRRNYTQKMWPWRKCVVGLFPPAMFVHRNIVRMDAFVMSTSRCITDVFGVETFNAFVSLPHLARKENTFVSLLLDYR